MTSKYFSKDEISKKLKEINRKIREITE